MTRTPPQISASPWFATRTSLTAQITPATLPALELPSPAIQTVTGAMVIQGQPPVDVTPPMGHPLTGEVLPGADPFADAPETFYELTKDELFNGRPPMGYHEHAPGEQLTLDLAGQEELHV